MTPERHQARSYTEVTKEGRLGDNLQDAGHRAEWPGKKGTGQVSVDAEITSQGFYTGST